MRDKFAKLWIFGQFWRPIQRPPELVISRRVVEMHGQVYIETVHPIR
jgi:hypothetical protein